MPGKDRTGPVGRGAGTGRLRGSCFRSGEGLSGFIQQLILNNLVTIIGFAVTACAHFIGRKLYLQHQKEKELILTAKPVGKNRQIS